MGQQSNKIQKRARRKAYMIRKKDNAKVAVSASKKKK